MPIHLTTRSVVGGRLIVDDRYRSGLTEVAIHSGKDASSPIAALVEHQPGVRKWHVYICPIKNRPTGSSSSKARAIEDAIDYLDRQEASHA